MTLPVKRVSLLCMFVKLGSRTVNVVSFGSGSTTLLAIGGWIGTWQIWRMPLELLSTDWRCVAYDHRGSGQTLAPVSELTIEGLVDDVFGVADALGVERCWLAGESQGGLVALLAAARQPERFEGIVTIAAPSRWESTPDRELFIQGLAHDRHAMLTRFVRWCMPEPNTETLQRWVLQLLMESEPEAGPALIRNLYGCALPGNISELRMPALVIHGRQDTIIPPDNAAQIATAVPGARLLLLDAVGHVPTVTRPRQVAEAIRSFVGTG